ncbi:MAG: outer membrane protein assembly factor BamD [Sedimentisphaerales bacterium]|nr:outer membrane protein assembly factor BamD [Sedimentisphaerales bacterium]
MLKYKKLFICLFAAYSLINVSAYASNTWFLQEDQNWDLIATDEQKQFVVDLAEVQNIVNKGKTKGAKKQFASIKKKYPELAGKELNLFIKAELLLSQMKLTESARSYDKLLSKYTDSILRNMAIKRQYEIGITYLNGRKKVVLGLFAIKGDNEGIGILEKMIDHAGFDSQIAIDASVKIAKNYEKREKFNEAYLKWYEIYSLGKTDNIIKRDALLGMAQAKHAIYDKNPESRKPFYDASSLRSARSYYEMLKTYYPEYAEQAGIKEILNIISEQMAYKELSIGLYYQKMGNIQSANLYFDMVINNWPKSKSAEIAQNKLNENTKS